MAILLAGVTTGLALIVAIGAQNAFVLRQGIRRDQVLQVVLVCIVSDIILIWLGTLGMARLFESAPWFIALMRWLGAAYLLWFAYRSARSALQSNILDPGAPEDRQRSPVAVVVALTWLNPHVYLDTVIMFGGLANQYGTDRWLFAVGATLASVVWFSVLGFGARFAAPFLQSVTAWRVIDAVIAVIMVLLALGLILS